MKTINTHATASAHSSIASMRKFAVNRHDSDLELEADPLKAYYLTYIYWCKSQTARITAMLHDLAGSAVAQGNIQINARHGMPPNAQKTVSQKHKNPP